jgi:ATP-dependent DNA helicase RecG
MDNKLLTPLQEVRGIGSERAQRLQRLGLHTASDLLFHFPRDYQDLSDERPIVELEEDKLQSVCGQVVEVAARSTGFGKSRVQVLLSDGTHLLKALWFNQPFMQRRFHQGQRLIFSAKPSLRGSTWQMSHPQITWLGDDEQRPVGSLLPIYALTEGISQYHMRRFVQTVVEDYAALLEEVFPPALLTQYELLSLQPALASIHQPADSQALLPARRRFVFQELFVLQLALSIRRDSFQQLAAPELPTTAKINARILRLLPFELTASQEQAIDEVSADMALDRPMNRLLQGDVGSGKTVVALYAMLVAVAHGWQTVLMVPTEILARQHARTLHHLLEASRVRYALLTGGLATAERRKLLDDLALGQLDMVIGTQAIIQDGVTFDKLGLVVIDEQHKFGVRQRAALREDDRSPHTLVMTATPIPRTMSMTLFGDLDVSTLSELPQGRQPVNTYLVTPEKQARWWAFVRDRLREGRQAYVVVPLVDESETINAPSVAEAFEQLTNGELADFRLGLLHGRMPSSEKDQTMLDFVEGRTQVLVSTTVVEVGVDVANASVMTVAGAERFGLSQLHQLRGRIGRGSHSGFCAVMVDAPAESDEDANASPDPARARLESFVATTDGFVLAELDFELRGPGDLFGTQQHGMPPLRIANLLRDRDVLNEARREAQLLVAADPGLKHADHAKLRSQMLKRYGQALDISDVG